MGIVVQKYGGSSVADLDRLRAVASRVVATAKAGHRVVVVVSAMGRTTDDLLSLAKSVNSNPSRRELDMLLTVGERVSMALLSLAIGNLGREAISFTGSQSGIITDERHSDARIVEVRPRRIEEELARERIVIVAGFQGVSRTREVTTLGRGGSDTTAVALAAALGADFCEICSDVDGIYTGDPRIIDAPEKLERVSYQEMQELAESGAKVLCAQAVEWAKKAGITIFARATADPPLLDAESIPEIRGTRIEKSSDSRRGVVGVASEKCLVAITAPSSDIHELQALNGLLFRLGVEPKQVSLASGVLSLLFSTTNLHDLNDVKRALLMEARCRIRFREGVGAVSIIGSGVGRDSDALNRLIDIVRLEGAESIGVHSSSFRLTVLLLEADVDRVTRAAHKAFVGTTVASS